MPTPMETGGGSGWAGKTAGGGGGVLAWSMSMDAGAPWRREGERGMEDLAKGVMAGSASFARQREPSAKIPVPGNVVISGRAARCNKPSAGNRGVNLAQEVEPHRSVRLPRVLQNLHGQDTPARGKLNIQRFVAVFYVLIEHGRPQRTNVA